MLRGIGRDELGTLAEWNTEFVMNERGLPVEGLSGAPFPAPIDHEVYVEEDYGRVWDATFLAEQRAPLAGPVAPLSIAFANFGLLSVPFRRVPRRMVTNAAEFLAAVAVLREGAAQHYPGRAIVLRGQVGEYTLLRDKAELDYLYGSRSAREPSLRPSGSRRDPISPRAYALWSQLSQLHSLAVGISTLHPPRLVALALAQHYGLPTPALDVTTDPLVALWFAMHRLEQREPSTVVPVRPTTGEGVVYVLAAPEGQVFDDARAPSGLRPRRQSGGFLAANWGNAKNRAARYVVGAVYFEHADFSPPTDLPTARHLFPGPSEDWFLELVHQLMRSAEHANSEVRREIADHVYWVHDVTASERTGETVSPLVANQRGVELEARGQLRASEVEYEKAASLGDAAAAFNLGQSLAKRGMVAAAESWLRQAMDAGDADAAASLGYVLTCLGRRGDALAVLRRHASDHAACAYNLAVILSESADQHVEAFWWLAHAADLGDEDAARLLRGDAADH